MSSVLVLGAAVSGAAAARLARRLGHGVAVYDADPTAVAPLRDEGYEVHSGSWSDRHLTGRDLVVTSPGFAPASPPVSAALAAGVPVRSELEFAAARLTVPYAAVTGTNGKTTVATEAARMLTASGVKAVAAGNVGLALSTVVDEPWDAVVVEASSFQLYFVERFHPAVAAVVNVAPDHLDWHGSIEAYAAAKARIFENMGPEDLLVFDADDPGAAALVAPARARLLPVSGTRIPPEGAGVAGGSMHLGCGIVPIEPTGFAVDLVIAAEVAAALGGTVAGIASAVAGFSPAPHRRVEVARRDGVVWIDDSKATNPHAALASVAAHSAVVLIAGGRNKGLDLSPLATAPQVRHLIALGEAATELAAARDPGETTVVTTMDDAVARAAEVARPGDVVLLAPGCASFDMFDSYAARGEAFARAVREVLWPAG